MSQPGGFGADDPESSKEVYPRRPIVVKSIYEQKAIWHS
jgi:hypothetical protein